MEQSSEPFKTPLFENDLGRTLVSEVGRLWMRTSEKTEKSGALIGVSDGDNVLAITGDSIAFVANGAVFACSIVEMSKASFDELLAQKLNQEAVENAKQVVLAIFMYMADHDDNLPAAATFQSSMLSYLKDAALLSQFNYTYTGNTDLNSLDDIGQTPLGFMQGKGGRAVVFADGHVKWVSD